MDRGENIPLTKCGQTAGTMIQISLEPVGTANSGENARRDPDLIDLVRRAQREEAAAQAELLRLFRRRIAGYVRSILREPEWEEDATQTVFIKAFRRLPALREPAVFKSWLFRIARNTALDFRRRRACRPVTVAMDEEAEAVPAPSAGCGLDEIRASLDFALARLNPLDRRLVRGYVAGTSYDALARRTGLSLSSVKVRLHRVRPYLRDTVGEMTGTRLPEGGGWRPRGAA
jgi:RNA polymerase sigma-70 factor (ECF subfamily)